MRKTLKGLALASVAAVALMPLNACGGTSANREQVDASRTQLYVSNFYGGLRDGWLVDLKQRFEEFYAEESFEDGKKGVQVLIDNNQFTGFNFETSLVDSYNNVFFTENVMYYNFVNKNMFEDITVEVTAPLTEYNDPRSIEQKLYGGYADFYKTDDGKYYGLPFYEAYPVIAYNVDLFDDNGYYFVKGGAPSEYCEFTQTHNDGKTVSGAWDGNYVFVTGESDERSAGPDGLYGTSDDGLPATYDEFFALCERMTDDNVAPIVWPGAAQDYLNETASALWADFEGAEKLEATFNFAGEQLDIVTGFDGNKPIVTPTDIDVSNAYLLYQQEGRYHAIDFISRIIRNKYYHPDSFGIEVSQMASQEDFLYGALGYPSKRKVGMIADGSWWQNEANDTYNTLAADKNNPNLKKDMNIGNLPLPKATLDKVGEKTTYMSAKQTAAFIKKGTSGVQLKLAKMFIRFAHTDESLVKFQQIVNMPKPYDYEMTEAQLAECTRFGKDLYAAHKTKNIAFNQSKSKAYNKVPSAYLLTALWQSQIGKDGPMYNTVSQALQADHSAISVFNGLAQHSSHTKDGWDLVYGEFY